MDYDNEVGFWIYGLPYVWIDNKDMKKCRRLYLVYNEDDVNVSHKTYKKYSMKDRRVEFGRIVGRHALNFDDISTLDMWSSKDKKCSWGSRYFGVFNSDLFKGVSLKDLDVRVNGKKMSVPTKPNVLGYLNQVHRVKKSPKFIKYPEWLQQE